MNLVLHCRSFLPDFCFFVIMSAPKLFFTVLFICVALGGFSQTYRSDFSKRFSFGLSFSPDYTYRMLSADVDDGGLIDMRNETESARFGYTTGLTVKYLLSERWVLESGLQYADRGDKMESDEPGYIFPDDSDPFIPDESKSLYHYNFLGIPLKANFYLLNGRTKLFLSAGVSADFFSGSKTKQIHTYDGREIVNSFSEEGVDFNSMNVMGLAGFGVDYELNRKLELRFEPIVRYSFSSLTTYTDLHTYLYAVGVNFAVYF